MAKEYTRFGDKILQRAKGSGDEWEDVPADDAPEAETEIRVAERLRAESLTRGGQFGIEIIRGGGRPSDA